MCGPFIVLYEIRHHVEHWFSTWSGTTLNEYDLCRDKFVEAITLTFISLKCFLIMFYQLLPLSVLMINKRVCLVSILGGILTNRNPPDSWSRCVVTSPPAE